MAQSQRPDTIDPLEGRGIDIGSAQRSSLKGQERNKCVHVPSVLNVLQDSGIRIMNMCPNRINALMECTTKLFEGQWNHLKIK